MTLPELTLVIPCYNEAARLDASAILQFSATPSTVSTLRLTPNAGKAEAVRTGIRADIEQGAPLMGRGIRRKAARHYSGRVFATAASHALDLPVYDTQCGARVLRVTADTATLFEAPFRSRWVFDVELLARYLRLPRRPGEPDRRDRIYELALATWRDKAGSKRRWYDFVRAAVDVLAIWRERVAHRVFHQSPLAQAGRIADVSFRKMGPAQESTS